MSHNQREKVCPRSDVPVIKMEKFEVRQVLDENGVSHSSLVPVNANSVLDLPFRTFSMQSYDATGEISRLHFMSPKSDMSFDVFDRVNGDLSELSAKVDHMSLLDSIASESSSDVK